MGDSMDSFPHHLFIGRSDTPARINTIGDIPPSSVRQELLYLQSNYLRHFSSSLSRGKETIHVCDDLRNGIIGVEKATYYIVCNPCGFFVRYVCLST